MRFLNCYFKNFVTQTLLHIALFQNYAAHLAIRGTQSDARMVHSKTTIELNPREAYMFNIFLVVHEQT